MSVKPTGHYQQRADGLYLEFDRLFHAPIEDVWYSLTNRNAMKQWVGTYTGSPATGAVKFRMNAEEGYAEDEGWEPVSILFCDPPHHFVVDTGGDAQHMRLLANLTEQGGLTAMTFGQRIYPQTDVASMGPGWDYYLDRLVAARTHAPMPEWDTYFPAFKRHYQDLTVPPRKPTPSERELEEADDGPAAEGLTAMGTVGEASAPATPA